MRVGIFNCYWSTRGGGERHAGAIAEVLSRDHRVDLIGIEPIDVEELATTLNLDLGRTRFRQWPAPPDPSLPARTARYDLFFNTTFWSGLPSRARGSAYLTFFPQPLLGERAVRLGRLLLGRPDGESADTRPPGVGSDLRRTTGRSLVGRIRGRMRRELRFRDPTFLPTYDLLMANSGYTQRWIRRRWGRDSELLPPPVDTEAFRSPPPSQKRPVILSVGRFFHGAHNKKQPRMLRVFRRMCDRGELLEGWELHMVGNVHRDRLADLEYWARVEHLARGYPVRLLPDLPFPRLLEEYRRASIFWHAAGWGESERRHPEKLEHFGLTTCEAMSSGCIPVVIGKAGQLEIVRHGESGFFFDTERELRSRTAELARGFGRPWVEAMRRRAAAAVERYGREPFERRLLAILRGHRLLP